MFIGLVIFAYALCEKNKSYFFGCAMEGTLFFSTEKAEQEICVFYTYTQNSGHIHALCPEVQLYQRANLSRAFSGGFDDQACW